MRGGVKPRRADSTCGDREEGKEEEGGGGELKLKKKENKMKAAGRCDELFLSLLATPLRPLLWAT